MLSSWHKRLCTIPPLYLWFTAWSMELCGEGVGLIRPIALTVSRPWVLAKTLAFCPFWNTGHNSTSYLAFFRSSSVEMQRINGDFCVGSELAEWMGWLRTPQGRYGVEWSRMGMDQLHLCLRGFREDVCGLKVYGHFQKGFSIFLSWSKWWEAACMNRKVCHPHRHVWLAGRPPSQSCDG